MPQLYELNIRDYFNILIKRKWIMMISFLVVSIGTFSYTNLQKPVYQAVVIIKIVPSMLPSTIVFPSQRVIFPMEEELPSYQKQITSYGVLEEAAVELKLIAPDDSLRRRNEIITDINAQLKVDRIESGNMLRLTVSSGDPYKAAMLANTITAVFKKINVEDKNQLARNVRTYIENTLKEMEAELKKQEARLRTLTTRGAVGSGLGLIESIHRVEKERMNLLSRFTRLHPDVIKLENQIADLKQDLKRLPKEEFEYGILKRDLATNEALYSTLKQKLYEAKIREAEKIDNVVLISPAIAPKSPSYPQKSKNYAVGLALGLVTAISMALIIEHLDTSIGRVDDVESFIKVGVLGVIPYCSEKPTQHLNPEEIWPGIFSRKKQPEKREVHLILGKQKSIFSEAFRILSVNLQVVFGKSEKIKNKILMITSSNPEEGKTTLISHLSVTLAQMGYKTLLIDLDTRRAAIHKVFGLDRKGGGFTDILTGKLAPDAAVKTAADLMLGDINIDDITAKPWLDNLNIVTAGSLASNIITLFNSEKMAETLNYFRNKYDIVMLDTSPILAVSEPSILLPRTDGVLLVYRAGSTSRLALRRAKTQIESVKGKGGLSGVILNNVTPEIGLDTYYYYSNKYYLNEEEPSSKEKG